MKISIRVLAQDGHIKSSGLGDQYVSADMVVMADDLATLGIKAMTWQFGDQIEITISQPRQYLWIQLDETLNASLVYIKGHQLTFPIPIAIDDQRSRLDTAFKSKRHLISVRRAASFEIKRYQNLALNPHDQALFNGSYPHASSTVTAETDAVFFAQNAIDGKLANSDHGSYPFQSWGIHQNPQAQLMIDFGREVELDCLKLLFRADFPHDNYWTGLTIVFSNGQTQLLSTTKKSSFQIFKFAPQRTTKIVLKDLKLAAGASKFPALTQLEAYGYNVF